MNSKFKTLIGIVVFVAFIGVAYFAYSALSDDYKPNNEISADENSPQDESEQVPAPDFTVLDSKGNEVKLSDFKGKPVVINFWASWCPPCKTEMPHFNKVYGEVKNDVVFMMIDLIDGQRETLESGQKYIEKEGFTFPVYFDTEQMAASTYGIRSIPTTIFVNADGNIVTGVQGAIDEETLKQGIDLIK